MEEYVENMKLLQRSILDFVERKDNLEEDFQNLTSLIQNQNILKDPHEIKALLYLILKISNNHNRSSDLFEKIEKILLFLKQEITQTFSNIDIFNIFKNNKKIIYFLIEQKILTVDNSIYLKMMDPKYQKLDYPIFFSNYFKNTIEDSKISDLLKDQPDNFEEKQKNCENDSKICEIIRNDSVEEFISYTNQTNLSLTAKIERSIFETNPFLLKNKPTLIEYAAFYGSIEIIKYLKSKNVDLSHSLWLYSIHSNKEELIHFLEENHVNPSDESYEECMKEAIKCHHNEIANYIKEKLLPKKESAKEGEEPKISRAMRQNIYSSAIRYYNYAFFENYFNNNLCFIRFCQYDYFKIVESTLKNNKMDVNYMVISKKKIL
ncbi:hypothetical protein M9Y10_009943 [Tritrichomonas musculus]|uniref:DUF3447 domain-containing protein n=1 Tax=Tritrichomonas musculus TaxID=1915356 RepID=A0ABR2IPY3_9EUKA